MPAAGREVGCSRGCGGQAWAWRGLGLGSGLRVGAEGRGQGRGQGQGQGRCPAWRAPVAFAAVESRKPEAQHVLLPLLSAGAPQHSATLQLTVDQVLRAGTNGQE